MESDDIGLGQEFIQTDLFDSQISFNRNNIISQDIQAKG